MQKAAGASFIGDHEIVSEQVIVTVILYHDDFPFEDRISVEEELDPAVQCLGAKWIGSGTFFGKNKRSCFDIAYIADDPEPVAEALRRKLREMGAEKSTESRIGGRTTLVYE